MSSVEIFPYFDFSQTHYGVRKFLYGEGLMLTVRQYEKPPAASPPDDAAGTKTQYEMSLT